MKDSGVEWLGEIPADWTVAPVVSFARVLTSNVDKKTHDGEVPVRLCNYTDVYYSDRIVDASGFMEATASREQISRLSVRAGDVPFTKDSETADDIGIPAYVPAGLPGVVYGYHLGIYRPLDKRRSRFLRYQLESDYVKAVFEARTPGVTRVGLSQNTIRYLRVPTPPTYEAVAIADFLDRETAQIDEFVAENERFIELLTERRAAAWDLLYARARQEGPFLPLARGLKSIVDGPFGSSLTSAHYTDEGTRVIRLGNIGINEFRDADVAYIDNEYAHQLRAHEARPGDVIIAGLGDERMPLGRACALPDIGPAIVKADCYRARPNERLESRYLAWVLSAPASGGLMNLEARGATRARLNTEVVKRVRIPMPSIELQRELVAAHSERTARIDEAIATAREGISLAKERRSALISAAVTGKIDVGSGS